jgi:predicted permease
MIFKATKSIHPDAHKGINTWILYIALPAVSFKYLPKVQWSQEMLFPIISTFLIAIGSWFFMLLYSKKKFIRPGQEVHWSWQVDIAILYRFSSD